MFPFKKKHIFLMDENVKMSETDIKLMKNCNIINSTDKFPKGTDDSILTAASKKNGWIIVTKDTRMAIRSMIDNVKVIYISDELHTISFINVHLYNPSKYPEMFEYISKRFSISSQG